MAPTPVRRILVVNGPNLDLLGTRRPDVYGTTTLAELDEACRRWGDELEVEVDTYQSNHEGDLVERLHRARREADGVVVNAGALTHYSYSLHDALEALDRPAVEVHISNVEEREPWRRISVIRPACVHTVYGRGVDGYRWAIRHLVHRSRRPVETRAYGAGNDRVMDLRRPDGAPRAAAVLVHGGCWRHEWARDVMDGISVDLAERGFATANVEYRRIGTGGGWPRSVDDVVDSARSAADVLGASPLLLIGHGSGAHLALLAAARLAGAGLPVAAVSLAGVTDLTVGLRQEAVEAFLAGADPALASPVLLDPPECPLLVAHGTDDAAVPPEQSLRFASHTGARLLMLEGGDHEGFLDPAGPMWQEVASALTGLLAAD